MVLAAFTPKLVWYLPILFHLPGHMRIFYFLAFFAIRLGLCDWVLEKCVQNLCISFLDMVINPLNYPPLTSSICRLDYSRLPWIYKVEKPQNRSTMLIKSQLARELPNQEYLHWIWIKSYFYCIKPMRFCVVCYSS